MSTRQRALGEKPKSQKSGRQSVSGSGFFEVSQSKLKTWRRCRRAYSFRYIERLKKRVKARPLTFGSLVHSVIETHASGADWRSVLRKAEKEQGKLFRAEYELYGDIINDVRVIMTDYFKFHEKNDLTYTRINGRRAEHEFRVRVDDGIVVVGKVDAFAKRNQLTWLVEHKTFGKQMPSDDERWRDLQSSVYLWIGELLGWPQVDGLCWDYIRSKPPSQPQFLKSGNVAQRAIDTLPTKVREFCDEHDIGGKTKVRLLSMADKNQPRSFKRIFVPTKPDVVDNLVDDFLETSREMMDLHGKRQARTIDRHCSWCDYEPICRAELRGEDAEFIKEHDYVVSEKVKSGSPK